jgi:hypothetical protein
MINVVKVLVIPLVLVLVGTQLAYATNELTPHAYYSPAWNAGYSQGTHTKAFFYGYFNGTMDFWYNVGYACGISGKTNPPPGHYGFCGWHRHLSDTQYTKFRWGNTTGWKNRIDMLGSDNYSVRYQLLQTVLPVNTTDGYKDYFVGFANGIQSRTSPHYNISNVFTFPCNGTAEYCNGFRAGWNDDWGDDD